MTCKRCSRNLSDNQFPKWDHSKRCRRCIRDYYRTLRGKKQKAWLRYKWRMYQRRWRERKAQEKKFQQQFYFTNMWREVGGDLKRFTDLAVAFFKKTQ